MANKQETIARAIWRSADAVCFDVDSTVCRDEAIDELAKFVDKEKEVAEITRIAMRGDCSFHDALARRLEMIQPSMDIIKEYIKNNPPRYTPGIKELVNILHRRSVDVYLVSGGFQSVIEPVAKDLGIPIKNIFANCIKFYYDGTYAGFDETRPTAHQDGKGRVIEYLKSEYGYNTVVMIGDGVTDLEACPPADAFIGFGGNQIRPRIKSEAAWFVTSFHTLTQEIRRN